MFDIQNFAQNLQKSRKEQGMTQSELAERLLVSPQSVSFWERGKGMPDVSRLCEIAQILSVSLDDLFRQPERQIRSFVGVDGGGTKTEFLLIDETGKRIDSMVLEGCNPNTCGIQGAIGIIRRGLELLRPRTRNVAGIFVGGAGFDVGDHAERMISALKESYPGIAVGCANDIYNVIACSAQPDHCIAAISGTGCTVYSSLEGRVRRVGGLGYLFERYGSGYDIGRDAISAALWAEDGTGERTLLTDLVEEKLGGTAWDHIDTLYQSDISYIASFAPLVSQAAEQGDRVALDIMERSSEYMAKMIHAAQANAPGVHDVILSGSLLAKNDLFFQMVEKRLDPQLTLERVTWPPVWGACLQCARMCGIDKMPSLENYFNSSIDLNK